MAEAKSDGNRVRTLLGDNSGTPVNIAIDNATGYVKIILTVGTLGTPASVATNATRDNNRVPVLMGTNVTTPVPVSIDNSTGKLKVIVS